MEYNIKNTGNITYLSELTQPFQQGSLRVGLRKGWVKFAQITYVRLRSVSYALI
jgi:hypothetical protein